MSYSPPPGPAGPSPYGAAPRTNVLAIGALGLGVGSLLVSCLCWLGAFPGLLAMVLGFVARTRIAASQGQEKGSGLAVAGVVTGAVSVLVSILWVVLFATGTIDLDTFETPS